MARMPISQLSSRYLFCGPLYLARPCSHNVSSARRNLVSSAVRRAETATSSAPDPALEERGVPLIKHLRQQAKAQKAAGKKSNAELQIVPGWELTVGIEIHAQLNTQRKLFSAATPPLPSDKPNAHTALFDLAIPGSQPTFQPETLIPAVRAALALECKIQHVSRWDRKHYFWWDQPNGYQITQFYEPFAKDGLLRLYERDGIAREDGEKVIIGIQQIQMEQDTGKTLAGPDGLQWIDFNRVGVPLIEIITKPVIRHPRTAAAFVQKVQAYLRSVDACVSGMEAGGLRADVNVSVRRTDEPGISRPLGQRTEIKNLSSFKAVEDAIIAERDRQIAVLEQGGVVLGETRGWTIGGTETTHLRGKEGEVDYRYMPDPDLGPLVISQDLVTKLKKGLAMRPDAEFLFLHDKWGLPANDIMALVHSGKLEYFYQVVRRLQELFDARTLAGSEGKHKNYVAMACNWVLHELGRLTSERNVSADGSFGTLDITPGGESSRVPAPHLAEIIFFLWEGRISKQVAKELLFSVYRGELTGDSSSYSTVEEAIVRENLWFRHFSESEHEDLAADILAQEQETLETKFRPYFFEQKSYPEGQLMRFVGMMMRAAPIGRVNPQTAARVLRRAIEATFKGPGE